MKIVSVFPTCGECGTVYHLPYAELAFAYGTFLGVSKNHELREVNGLENIDGSPWDAVSTKVRELHPEAHWSTTAPIVQAAFAQLLDRASDGSAFEISELKQQCPRCDALSPTKWMVNDQLLEAGADVDLPLATHACWDGLSGEERAEAVGAAIGVATERMRRCRNQ